LSSYFLGTALVVGWGQIQNCSTAWATPWTIDSFKSTMPEAIAAGWNPVPYVADFSTAQPQTPKPFYCTMSYDGTGGTQGDGTYFFRHDWYFYHLPTIITLLSSQLYADPDWQW
jgi:hypothetical protein